MEKTFKVLRSRHYGHRGDVVGRGLSEAAAEAYVEHMESAGEHQAFRIVEEPEHETAGRQDAHIIKTFRPGSAPGGGSDVYYQAQLKQMSDQILQLQRELMAQRGLKPDIGDNASEATNPLFKGF